MSGNEAPAETVSVSAPATIANVGPGFDVFGLALEGPCDTLLARRTQAEGVTISGVAGVEAPPSRDPTRNTAGIAAAAALARRRGTPGGGISFTLVKGIPLSSGLGSSAASAVAGACAVSRLYPGTLELEDLLAASLEAEAQVSGRHLDNVAAAMLGGFCLVEGLDPPRIRRVRPRFEIWFAAVKPEFGLSTREARAALPAMVPLAAAIANLHDAVRMVDAAHRGDLEGFLAGIRDRIVEPARAPLIKGHDAVRQAADAAGALATGISGAGPTLFAAARSQPEAAGIAKAMSRAWMDLGVRSFPVVSRLSERGAFDDA